jgi:DegV family protein with EDD domain
MSKIAIVTDSTADIPVELVKKNNITVVPLYLNFEDASYIDDGVDITSQQFYEKLRNVKVLPKTAQPTPSDFMKAYKNVLENNESIMSIHISKKMSGTIDSAEIAKKELAGKDITIIDSELVHIPLGIVVLKAAELAEKGKTKEEIIEAINNLKQQMTILFIPRSLKYLIMGGRIGRARGLIASILEINPILTLHLGEVSQYKTTRRWNQAKNELIESMKSLTENPEKLMIIVSDSDTKDEGAEMAERITKEFNPKQIMRATIGAIVGIHLGPDSIAVTFYEG